MAVIQSVVLVLLFILPYWPGGGKYDVEPVYPDHVKVIDKMIRRLSGDEKLAWRTARNRALQEWNGCDSRLTLEVGPGVAWEPGTITLNKGTHRIDELFQTDGTYGGYSTSPGYGLAVFDFWSRSIIAHEVGHALGFGHSSRDDSVMSDNPHVSSVDCEGLRRYY